MSTPNSDNMEKPDINDFLDEDLSAEEKKKLFSGEEAKPDANPQIKEEAEETFDIKGPEHSNAPNSMEAYKASLSSMLPKVEVTPHEWAAFEESIILNQEPFRTTITIPGKTREFRFTIRVRMAHEYRLIYLLVAKEQQEDKLPDYPAMLTRMQELAMGVMLLSIEDRAFEHADILPNPWKHADDPDEFNKALESAFNDLRQRTTTRVDSMSQPLFMLALDAFRIFEAKCFMMLPDIMKNPFQGPEQQP